MNSCDNLAMAHKLKTKPHIQFKGYLRKETYPNGLGGFIFRGFFSFSVTSSFRLRFFIPRSSVSFNFAI